MLLTTFFSIFYYFTFSDTKTTPPELLSSNSKQYFQEKGSCCNICDYAANMLQICRKLIFFNIFCILHSQTPKIHMLTYFHPIPSNISEKKDAAAIFAILQQKCCKNAAKIFFFNEHPFWLFLSCKKLPIPKFSCFAQKNNLRNTKGLDYQPSVCQ